MERGTTALGITVLEITASDIMVSRIAALGTLATDITVMHTMDLGIVASDIVGRTTSVVTMRLPAMPVDTIGITLRRGIAISDEDMVPKALPLRITTDIIAGPTLVVDPVVTLTTVDTISLRTIAVTVRAIKTKAPTERLTTEKPKKVTRPKSRQRKTQPTNTRTESPALPMRAMAVGIRIGNSFMRPC